MIKLGNFTKIIGAVACVLLITSCEQPDGEAEFINTNDEEAFASTTGKSNTLKEDTQEAVKPLLHMRFDGNLSKKEITARFDEEVVAYLAKHRTQNKGLSTEWYYRVATLTGSQSGNNTDGNVRASAYFYTDKGAHFVKNIALEYPSIDERELGQWDYYLFKTSLPGQAVSWVKINHSNIQLQGTDDWFVKEFHIYTVLEDQTVPATGETHIYTFPNVWLANSCGNCWDSYQKRGGGVGTLNF